MNIKIEPGANVQITDKPIYNIYGDVVNEKKVLTQAPAEQGKFKSRKPESRQADKKLFDSDTFRDTFTYWPDGMSQEEREIRLKMAFSRMRAC